MKTLLIILFTVGIVIFFWALFAWGATANFDTSITADNVKQLVASQGLQICDEKNLSLTVPGFTSGKKFVLSVNCATDTDPINVAVVNFSSRNARNAAIQRVESVFRNGFGPNLAYVYGPYVIVVQGSRGIENQIILGKALKRAGATP